MRARTDRRLLARILANAAALHLPVTEYLALPRAERKRRLADVRKES